MDIKEYQILKAKVESAQRQHDRIEGALEQKVEQLESEFGCNNIEEANTMITKEEKEISRLQKEYNTRLKAFESKWGEA